MTVAAPDQAPLPAVRQPVAVGGLIADLDRAWRLAQALSQSGLIPKPLQNRPSDVLVVLLYGQEIGLGPTTAFQSIHVVDGRPNISARLWIALVRRAGHKAEIVRHTKDEAVVRITRGDDGTEHEGSFDMDDAKDAKLTDKDNWKKYRKDMLLARACTRAGAFGCPEVALGFVVSEAPADEPQQVESKRVTLAEAAAQRETPAGPAPAAQPEEDITDAVLAVDDPAAATPPGMPVPDVPAGPDERQMRRMHAMLGGFGLGGDAKRDDRLAVLSDLVRRPLDSSADLTAAEAEQVCAFLSTQKAPAEDQRLLIAEMIENGRRLRDGGEPS